MKLKVGEGKWDKKRSGCINFNWEKFSFAKIDHFNQIRVVLAAKFDPGNCDKKSVRNCQEIVNETAAPQCVRCGGLSDFPIFTASKAHKPFALLGSYFVTQNQREQS